ncbi:MAG: epoxyqueuosine reductase QueH [Candidatus Methylomirabilia bacterium]
MSVGRLLLHVCCAPCAAYPVPALRALVSGLTGFFFNPNIQPDDEHARRLDALERFSPALGLDLVIAAAAGAESWSLAVAGRGEDRCRHCYDLRLRATAREARRGGFDAFSTTLLYSIHQKHELVYAVATEVARAEGVPFFYRDLREGWVEGGRSYRESGLYRQRYCGCLPSKLERDAPRRKMDTIAGQQQVLEAVSASEARQSLAAEAS